MREFFQYEGGDKRKLTEDYGNQSVPFKIRKIELLKNVGLPVPSAEYFDTEDLDEIQENIRKKLHDYPLNPLILRFATIPNKNSMPVFYFESLENLNQLSQVTDLIQSDPSIKKIILQDATPKEKAIDKISGRLLILDESNSDIELILEIYKGSRSTSILNTVNLDDPNYLRFEKRLGKFLKPVSPINFNNTTIKEYEIRSLAGYLKEYTGKLEIAKDVHISFIKKQSVSHDACFEFSLRDGKINFSDID